MKTSPILGLLLAIGVAGSACVSDGTSEPKASTAAMDPQETVQETKAPLPLSKLARPDDAACRDRPVQLIETFWPDGTVKLRREVVHLDDGTAIDHGKTTSYREDGSKLLEYAHVCGVRHGQKRTWYRDGTKWGEGAYANGRDHGVWRDWFQDGTLSRRWTMDRGAWNGTYTEWHPTGKKRREVEWVNGVRQGAEIFWDETGKELKRVDYVDGIPLP